MGICVLKPRHTTIIQADKQLSAPFVNRLRSALIPYKNQL